MSAGISTRDSAATENSFIFLIFEGLCAATVSLWLNASTAAHRTRGTDSRANCGHGKEISEWFVLISVIYNDGTVRSRRHHKYFKFAERYNTRNFVHILPNSI